MAVYIETLAPLANPSCVCFKKWHQFDGVCIAKICQICGVWSKNGTTLLQCVVWTKDSVCRNVKPIGGNSKVVCDPGSAVLLNGVCLRCWSGLFFLVMICAQTHFTTRSDHDNRPASARLITASNNFSYISFRLWTVRFKSCFKIIVLQDFADALWGTTRARLSLFCLLPVVPKCSARYLANECSYPNGISSKHLNSINIQSAEIGM